MAVLHLEQALLQVVALRLAEAHLPTENEELLNWSKDEVKNSIPLSSFSEWHGIYINEIDMEKEDIIKNILSVCNDMGVSFHKKVKTDVL